MRRVQSFVVGAAAVTAAAVLLAAPSSPEIRAADHGDAPLVRSNQQLDINDVYIFASPADSSRTVMILTACPLAGIVNPTTFATRSDYTFRMDVNGDAVEDLTWAFTFSNPAADGTQKMTMKTKAGRRRTVSRGTTGTTLDLSDGTKVLAGLFDDPFFFDILGFRAGLAFSEETSSNFFRGVNTLAIVLEVPNENLPTESAVGFWATTGKGRKQVDRSGRPGINSVLLPGNLKDAFNAGRPKDDLNKFGDAVGATLTTLRGGEDGVDALVAALLPDVNTFTLGDTNGFGNLNGRKLEDDVIDIALQLLTGNMAATDFVGNDTEFQTAFPYLAPKNP
jgi:hypothetical protein